LQKGGVENSFSLVYNAVSQDERFRAFRSNTAPSPSKVMQHPAIFILCLLGLWRARRKASLET